MAIGIYKYENLMNHKIYIGQSVDISQRKREHLHDADNNRDNSIFHKALKKYGIENFSFEIIEECPQEDLNEREIYWIKYYNSQVPNGYNIDAGGNQFTHSEKPVEQYDLEGNLVKEYKSASEAARQLELFKSNITSACRGETSQCGGYQWKYKDSDKIIKKINLSVGQRKKKKILCFSSDGELIEEFEKGSNAAEWCGKKKNTISRTCRENAKDGGFYHKTEDFYWLYEEDYIRMFGSIERSD